MLNPFLSLLLLMLVFGLGIWLFRPERGLFWRWQRTRRMSERVQREDALKHMHRYERYGRHPTLESLAGALHITVNEAAELLAKLEAHKLLQMEESSFRLTPEGRDYALHVIRAHRLWERYLADETGFAKETWHDQADWAEHSLTPAAVEALAAELGHPTHDPHGDPIPTSVGTMVPHGGRPLTSMPVDEPVLIVHLEDEPEVIYAQLVAEGLNPGMVGRIVEASSERVRFWAGGEDHLLAPIVAANISVSPLPSPPEPEANGGQRLSSLQLDQQGEVISISRASRGSERRRFLDLGILPGTRITVEMTSPSGDPTAYRIREALIAIRREQADLIWVKPLGDQERVNK